MKIPCRVSAATTSLAKRIRQPMIHLHPGPKKKRQHISFVPAPISPQIFSCLMSHPISKILFFLAASNELTHSGEHHISSFSAVTMLRTIVSWGQSLHRAPWYFVEMVITRTRCSLTQISSSTCLSGMAAAA